MINKDNKNISLGFAYQSASQEWERMTKMAREMNEDFVKQMTPAIEMINATISGPAFKMAIEMIRANQEIADQINRVNIGGWTKILNSVDLRPLLSFEEDLKTRPRFTWTQSEDENREVSLQERRAEELLDEIGSKVTRVSEDAGDKVYLILKKDGRLINRDYNETGRALSPQLRKLVARLLADCIATSHLTLYSGYKNDETTRRGIQRLNRYGFGVLKLPVQIAVGEQDKGYRLAKCVRLKIEEQKF